MKYLTESIKILVIMALVVVGVGFVQAWTGPTATPPNGNTPAPINVSDVTQEKMGIFGSHGFFSLGTGWFSTSTRASWPPANLTLGINGTVGAKQYCDDNGLNCKTITELGGSSTTTPPSAGSCSASDIYDSGWVTIPANKMGLAASQGITLNHNLGTVDTIVYLETNDPGTYGISNQEEGGVSIVGQNGISGWYGGFWANKTANTIKVYIGENASGWNRVHVIVWKKGCGNGNGGGGTANVNPTITTYGVNAFQNPLNIGVHDYCALSYVDGTGSTNAQCSVDATGTTNKTWTLTPYDSQGTANQTVCRATCMDF